MFCSHDVCVAWAHLRLTNLGLVVHVGVKSAVPSSQLKDYSYRDDILKVLHEIHPEQNNLFWSVSTVKGEHGS